MPDGTGSDVPAAVEPARSAQSSPSRPRDKPPAKHASRKDGGHGRHPPPDSSDFGPVHAAHTSGMPTGHSPSFALGTDLGAPSSILPQEWDADYEAAGMPLAAPQGYMVPPMTHVSVPQGMPYRGKPDGVGPGPGPGPGQYVSLPSMGVYSPYPVPAQSQVFPPYLPRSQPQGMVARAPMAGMPMMQPWQYSRGQYYYPYDGVGGGRRGPTGPRMGRSRSVANADTGAALASEQGGTSRQQANGTNSSHTSPVTGQTGPTPTSSPDRLRRAHPAEPISSAFATYDPVW